MNVHFRRQSASAILMVLMLFSGSTLQASEEAIAGHTDEALLVAALNDIRGVLSTAHKSTLKKF